MSILFGGAFPPGIPAGGGGGGVSGIMPWNPKLAPTSPNAKDDEFLDQSVDPKWAEWDPAGMLTVSEDDYGLRLDIADDPASAENIAGIYQAVPTSDEFEIAARITVEGAAANYLTGGIFLAGNIAANPTTAPAFSTQIRISVNGADNVEAMNISNYRSQTAAFSQIAYADTLYLAMQWKASTQRACVWYSRTGVGWIRLTSASYDPTTVSSVTHMGISMNGYNASGSLRAEFFRVREASSGIINVAPAKLGRRNT